MKNRIKEVVEFSGLNYSKEVTKILLIDLVLIIISGVLYYFLRQVIYSVLIFTTALLIDFLIVYSFFNKKNVILRNREEEFVSILSYFEVYITNHFNVYQAFKSLLPYCTSWMQELINTMLSEVDNDKSVKPFVDFAKNFSSPIVGNVMLSIYQMIDQGENSNQMMQFTILFEQLSKAHKKDLIDKKAMSMDNISVFPLIGAGTITLVLTFSILSILGDLINVI